MHLLIILQITAPLELSLLDLTLLALTLHILPLNLVALDAIGDHPGRLHIHITNGQHDLSLLCYNIGIRININIRIRINIKMHKNRLIELTQVLKPFIEDVG